MELQVRKKDGSMEPFQKAKISSGVMKAGATAEQAEMIASKVEAWAQQAAENGVIDTSSIRVEVVDQLKAVNEEAGKAFEAYKKPEKEMEQDMPAAGPASAPVQAPSTPVEPPAAEDTTPAVLTDQPAPEQPKPEEPAGM